MEDNEDSTEMNLLKLDELILKYPELDRTLGWGREDLIVFYEGNLLIGRETLDKDETVLYISEDSLIRLIDYHKSLDGLKADFEQK